MLVKAPKGTRDMLIKDSYKWHHIEDVMRKVCDAYCFREIRTPIFEHTELFLRGVGATTDIVQKEMYTFEDKGKRSVTLRPEGTAGVVRAFLESGMFNDTQPTKMYYLSAPIFRYENPQAGRLRQHHQFGVEMFGAKSAACDAEVISLALQIFKTLGVMELSVNINSIGCPICRPEYNKALMQYLEANLNSLCHMCKDRFSKNPLRILDCKDAGCGEYIKGAPVVLDYLCGECSSHFDSLKRNLAALEIEYNVNPHIVRGLDYYTKTVFEIISNHIGSQGTVCGGGRYDGLVAEIGGPMMPGVGFGMGMERLLMVMESQGLKIPEPSGCQLYICTLAENIDAALKLAKSFRELGVNTEIDHMGKSFKAQFKYADKIGANYVAVVGGDEIEKNIIRLKDMLDGGETIYEMENISDIAKMILK